MYTFSDYERDRWFRDAGLRIDHLLLNSHAAKHLKAAGVDRGFAESRRKRPRPRVDRAPMRAQRKTRCGGKGRHAPARQRMPKPLASEGWSASSSTAIPLRALLSRIAKTILRRGGNRPARSGSANLLLRLYREEQPRAVIVASDTSRSPNL